MEATRATKRPEDAVKTVSFVAMKEAAPMSVPRNIQDSTQEEGQRLAPAATLNADGLTCGRLEPLIAQHLRALAPGEVLEIRSDREEAAEGIRAWVWLTGHTLVTVEQDQSARRGTYFIRKKTPQT
jgi:TusA-related sulfurtransferase